MVGKCPAHNMHLINTPYPPRWNMNCSKTSHKYVTTATLKFEINSLILQRSLCSKITDYFKYSCKFNLPSGISRYIISSASSETDT